MVSNSAQLDRRTKQHTQFRVSASNGSRDMGRTKSWRKKKKKKKKKKRKKKNEHRQSHKASPTGIANNQGNNLRSEATEGGQPRINPNHRKPVANTGSEREEPKVRPNKRAGAWITQRPESPSETQDTGRGAPPKEGRNRGTDAAYQPKSEQTLKEENHGDKRRWCGQRLRRQKSPKPRSRRRGHKPVTKPPQPQKRWRTNRHRKKMTNHEGQPRPPSQPTNAGDTVGQKHTHPKVREGQQGDRTVNPSRHHRNWSTLTQGAKPQLPQQASGAGEAHKEGKG